MWVLPVGVPTALECNKSAAKLRGSEKIRSLQLKDVAFHRLLLFAAQHVELAEVPV